MGNQSAQLHVVDLFILVFVILLSLFVGLYSAYSSKDRTIEEYILGKRTLKSFPVSLSLIASCVSAYTIIAAPAEIYLYGIEYIYSFLVIIIPFVIFHTCYLPVFYNLKITTLYEYLEKRFNNSVRLLCSTLYVIQIIFYVPVMLSLSSLALCQVCDINFATIVIVSGVVTTFYTALGGIRAVIWTDVVQTVFMLIGVIVLNVKGTIDIGGMKILWQRNYEGKRLNPPVFDFDFTERYGVWASLFGLEIVHFVHFFLNQGTVQRIISVGNLKSARRSSKIAFIGVMTFIILSNYNGLVAFATYYNCDPFTTQEIMTRDQLLPLLTMNVFKNMPGMAGLFVAAIISATLSSVSTALNSVAAVILQDYYKPFINRNVSEIHANIFIKLTALIIGAVTTALVFVVQTFGSAVQVTLSLLGTIVGSMTGIFTIGLFFPWCRSKPTLIGSIIGFAFVSWICIGAQVATLSGNLVHERKPLSVDECYYNFTARNITTEKSVDSVLGIYKIAPAWYSAFGFIVTVIVSLCLSFFMKQNDVDVMDSSLFSPFVQFLLKKKKRDTVEVKASLLNIAS